MTMNEDQKSILLELFNVAIKSSGSYNVKVIAEVESHRLNEITGAQTYIDRLSGEDFKIKLNCQPTAITPDKELWCFGACEVG